MGRGKALSMDLRERVVEAHDNGEGTLQELADRFSIGRTTLCGLLRRQRQTGGLEPSATRGKPPRSVDDEGRERIRALVVERPDATLPELTDAYNGGTARPISEATMGREIQRLKLTRKKRPSGRASGTRQGSKRGGHPSSPGS
jgi:transposase